MHFYASVPTQVVTLGSALGQHYFLCSSPRLIPSAVAGTTRLDSALDQARRGLFSSCQWLDLVWCITFGALSICVIRPGLVLVWLRTDVSSLNLVKFLDLSWLVVLVWFAHV